VPTHQADHDGAARMRGIIAARRRARLRRVKTPASFACEIDG
jgi:hypothetical protein